MPSKCSCSRSRFHSGVLSNRECGGCTSQPPVRNASIQCRPDRSMLTASALNTWLHAKIAPYPLDAVHRAPEVRRVRGQGDRAHGAGGGARDDGKWAGGAAPHQFGDALEHADLVGGTRAAARQHQADRQASRCSRRWWSSIARWSCRCLVHSEHHAAKQLAHVAQVEVLVRGTGAAQELGQARVAQFRLLSGDGLRAQRGSR